MKTAKSIAQKIAAGANIAVILGMLLVGYSDRISPASHQLAAVIGLTFPFFILLNLLFLVFWVIVRPMKTIIPIAGFLLCYSPIWTYSPLNVSKEAPAEAIKIISYNVFSFAEWKDTDSPSEIIDYLKEQDADIVCLQECGLTWDRRAAFKERMSPQYKHFSNAITASGGDEIIVCSKFPITGKDTIKYESQTNHSVVFRLNIHGDSVLLVANHLESIRLSQEEKQNFNTMAAGKMDKQSARAESRMLISKIGEASARRAPQADTVAKYVDEHKGQSILLCGDFNDSPISYTRRVIANGLTDCYAAAGKGPGISYNSNKMYVRIDYIMCSSGWTPYNCHVDNTIKASDHYPIVCQLKKEKITTEQQ